MKQNEINGFKNYLNEIGQEKILTLEEQLELGRRIKEENDSKAREELIKHNLKLVITIAKSYKSCFSKVNFEDLVQEGNTGLIIAVDKYDYKLGYKFSTCATPWIKQSILAALREQGKMIRLPAHVHGQLSKIRKATDELREELNREPTIEEIAVKTGFSEDKIDALNSIKNDTLELDKELNDEDKNTVGDLIADQNTETPSEYASRLDTAERIRKALDTFPKRTQEIMNLRYGFNPEKREYTLEEVGERLGLTRERIRQIEKDTLHKLKVMLG